MIPMIRGGMQGGLSQIEDMFKPYKEKNSEIQ